MKIPSKILIIFATSSVIIFIAVNSLYLIVNAEYWLNGSSTNDDTITTTSETHLFPLLGAKEHLTGSVAYTAITSPTPTYSAPAIPTGNTATLVINKIGVKAPIILGSSPNTQVIYKELESGVVKYFDAPKPGENGVSIILGHSSSYPWYKGKYGSVFALLGYLKTGDTFYVEYSDGQRFNYVVKQSLVFKPLTQDFRLTQIEKSDKPTLVLISCWPIGTNYQRIAVEAELVS